MFIRVALHNKLSLANLVHLHMGRDYMWRPRPMKAWINLKTRHVFKLYSCLRFNSISWQRKKALTPQIMKICLLQWEMPGHKKITPTRTDQWMTFLYFLKEDKKLTVQRLKITRNGEWWNLMIEKMQHTFQCLTSTKTVSA